MEIHHIEEMPSSFSESNRYLSGWLLILAGLLSLLIPGCSSGKAEKQEPRFAVSGEVTFNTKPLKNGRIKFIPVEKNGGIRSSGTIIDGKYSIKKINGPIAGKMRVEIQEEIMEIEGLEAQRGNNRLKTPLEFQGVRIPKQFNTQSTLIAQIKPDEENINDFKLTAKVKKRR